MSYVDQDIHRIGSTSPAQLRAALVTRGRNLAQQYAPGGIYREPTAGVELVIAEECVRYAGHAVDHDGVTVQINVETAGMQSKFWVERANPGGIGAVDNNPDLALWFNRDNLREDGIPIPREEAERRGIRAHVAKLLNYRFGEGEWTKDDPRAFAIRQRNWMGSCRTWRDLKGKWATSSTYDTTMEAVWTALAAIPGDTMATPYEHIVPGMGDLRPQLRRNPAGRSAGRLPLAQKRGIVIHFNGPDVGANDRQHIINVASYHCDKNWNTNPSGPHVAGDGIMYHVGVADDGTVYLLRDFEAGLWHSGSSWNDHSFAVYVPIGINQRATPVQLQALTGVVDRLRACTKEGREQVKGHMELSATNCPGTLMSDFVRPYRAGSSGPVIVEPDTTPVVPQAQLDPWRFDEAAKNYARLWNNGQPFYVLDPFVDWIHQRGGLMTVGHCVSGAFLIEGVLTQFFEGAALEWHPGNPPEHRVLRRHTGLEVLRERFPDRVAA